MPTLVNAIQEATVRSYALGRCRIGLLINAQQIRRLPRASHPTSRATLPPILPSSHPQIKVRWVVATSGVVANWKQRIHSLSRNAYGVSGVSAEKEGGQTSTTRPQPDAARRAALQNSAQLQLEDAARRELERLSDEIQVCASEMNYGGCGSVGVVGERRE